MKKIIALAVVAAFATGSGVQAQPQPPANLSFLEGMWSDNCIMAMQVKHNMSFIQWDGERRTFVRDYRSHIGDGKFHDPIISEVKFSLAGDKLVEIDGDTESHYLVSNVDSKALYNLRDPNAKNAPAMRMTALRINGSVIPSHNLFRKCLNN